MTTLDMGGHIDDVFESVTAQRQPRGGSYVNGRWVPSEGDSSSHRVNLQPMTTREIQTLQDGGERIIDGRRVYVNDGDLYNITPSDLWTFPGVDGTFKAVALDNRPWRNYCKIMVSRIDD